ncbi:MAG TPA: NUDIX hydrolase [Candidatus Baltobacteraceae bacterium]|jgi:8-oxo-dGTP pyrophosphatase MutT (NUDIX family)|nr:NUDIX hydrolase [Candidatus Baltobacteraceae bacterium]
MEKPHWRVRSSGYVVESPFMRLRRDEVELPDGTVIPEYYVRESHGFVIVFALTPAREVVLIEQYRYGNDSVIIELPAGTIDLGEDPLGCAQRELLEETGYTAPQWELVLSAPAEPVRSNAVMHCYIARDAVLTGVQTLDSTEHIDVQLATLERARAMLRDGTIASVASIAAGYASLDRIGA